MNWLNGKTVVLTGASGGIGRELTKILIRTYGANVVGIGRSEEKMRALSQELGAHRENFSYRLFDVVDRERWETFAQNLEQAGISPVLLINNAGEFPTFAKINDTPLETVENIAKINYMATMYATNALQTRNKRLSVVNVCSSAALCPIVGTAPYSASKAALKAYTEILQMEEKARYIGILYPGTTKTELFRKDENTRNSALDIVAMPAAKMAKKMARAIAKKRRRAVLGWDAKLMCWTAKFLPVKGPAFIAWVMKRSRSKVFKKVFH